METFLAVLFYPYNQVSEFIEQFAPDYISVPLGVLAYPALAWFIYRVVVQIEMWNLFGWPFQENIEQMVTGKSRQQRKAEERIKRFVDEFDGK